MTGADGDACALASVRDTARLGEQAAHPGAIAAALAMTDDAAMTDTAVTRGSSR